MTLAYRLFAASLLALSVAACSTALADPIPPPRRPYDAKTQLEYGSPPPPSGPRYR